MTRRAIARALIHECASRGELGNDALREGCPELTDAIEAALKARDERAAKICHDIVTFDADHEKFAPEAEHELCGWCEGLERAASVILDEERE